MLSCLLMRRSPETCRPRGTQQVSINVTEVQRGATETGSASTEVLSSAQSLSREGSRLKMEVASFLQSGSGCVTTGAIEMWNGLRRGIKTR